MLKQMLHIGPGSFSAPIPPDESTTCQEKQRQNDQEAPGHHYQGGFRKPQTAVVRGTWLNSDKIIITCEPIDHINAQIQILPVAKIGIGKKMAAPDNDNTLLM